MTLHAVVGHEDVRSTLARAHAAGTLPSALLVHGPRGIGKQRLALWLAQLVTCAAPSENGPCDSCPACRTSLKLEHPDVHWYFPLVRPKASGERLVGALEDARMEGLAERRSEPLYASHTEELKALYLGAVQNLRKRAHMRPTIAEGQIFIVGESEMLVPQESSPEAANALLKLLEEPPGRSRFILTSSEPGKLLPTIRSRTVPVHVSSLDDALVAGFLQETRETPENVAQWAAGLSQGSIGRALGFLPDGDDLGPLEELRRKAYGLVATALTGSSAAGYAMALDFPPARARRLVDLFAFVEEWLRDLGAVASGAPERVFNRDSLPKLEEVVAKSGVLAADLAVALSRVETSRVLALGNVNPQLVVSGLVRDLRRALKPRRPKAVAR